jgi:hypothetical protein
MLGCVSLPCVMSWVWYLLGGEISDGILKRTGNVRRARLAVVVFGFLCSFVSLLPVFLTRDLTLIALSLGAAFFFAELVIGPMWAIPMDIAPRYSGTAAVATMAEACASRPSPEPACSVVLTRR